jgi:hypothetical protein
MNDPGGHCTNDNRIVVGFRPDSSIFSRSRVLDVEEREESKRFATEPQRKAKVGKELLKTSRSGRDRRRSGTNSFWFYRHTTEILVFLCAL